MTAHAMNGDRESCLEAGMNGYISKPVQPAHLIATLERHLIGAAQAARNYGQRTTGSDPRFPGRRLPVVAMLPMASRKHEFPAQLRFRKETRGRWQLMRSSSSRFSSSGAAQPEAHQRKQHGRGEFEASVGLDASGEFPRHAHVPAQDFRDPFAAVVAQHEPQLQRAEAPAQSHAVFG